MKRKHRLPPGERKSEEVEKCTEQQSEKEKQEEEDGFVRVGSVQLGFTWFFFPPMIWNVFAPVSSKHREPADLKKASLSDRNRKYHIPRQLRYIKHSRCWQWQRFELLLWVSEWQQLGIHTCDWCAFPLNAASPESERTLNILEGVRSLKVWKILEFSNILHSKSLQVVKKEKTLNRWQEN